MKAIFVPAINGMYSMEAARVTETGIDDEIIRRKALAAGFTPEYASVMIDGRGYIEIKDVNGYFRYVQED